MIFSAGEVLIAVLITDKLNKCGRFDANFDRSSVLILLPDDPVRLFEAQFKLVVVDCLAKEESNISLLELRLNFGEFLHLLADRAVNGLPKLFVERMLITGR